MHQWVILFLWVRTLVLRGLPFWDYCIYTQTVVGFLDAVFSGQLLLSRPGILHTITPAMLGRVSATHAIQKNPEGPDQQVHLLYWCLRLANLSLIGFFFPLSYSLL